ncbi:hypothetical protein KCU65_g314, partial [Aureobasidium melanogenum]
MSEYIMPGLSAFSISEIYDFGFAKHLAVFIQGLNNNISNQISTKVLIEKLDFSLKRVFQLFPMLLPLVVDEDTKLPSIDISSAIPRNKNTSLVFTRNSNRRIMWCSFPRKLEHRVRLDVSFSRSLKALLNHDSRVTEESSIGEVFGPCTLPAKAEKNMRVRILG